jgi:hypothetical protein
MYAVLFAHGSAHKYKTTGNVEGNDVILTEACGCPLHVLGPKVGGRYDTYTRAHSHTHTHTHAHTHSVSYSKIPSSNFPRNQINSQILFILFYFLVFLIPPKANSGTAPQISGQGSVVGIATDYGLGGPGIESRWGRDFPHLSRPALGPTQPPVQRVPGFFTRGKERPGRDTDPSPPSSAVVKKG